MLQLQTISPKKEMININLNEFKKINGFPDCLVNKDGTIISVRKHSGRKMNSLTHEWDIWQNDVYLGTQKGRKSAIDFILNIDKNVNGRKLEREHQSKNFKIIKKDIVCK